LKIVDACVHIEDINDSNFT